MPVGKAGFHQQKDTGFVVNESFQESRNPGVTKNMEGKTFSNIVNIISGPTEEELDGLDLEERKRKRVGLDDRMEVEGGTSKTQIDSELSNGDCSGSPATFLAKLAPQASQTQ
ncbi:hypothetical protein ACET3Z_022558 [Daucus carota]